DFLTQAGEIGAQDRRSDARGQGGHGGDLLARSRANSLYGTRRLYAAFLGGVGLDLAQCLTVEVFELAGGAGGRLGAGGNSPRALRGRVGFACGGVGARFGRRLGGERRRRGGGARNLAGRGGGGIPRRRELAHRAAALEPRRVGGGL